MAVVACEECGAVVDDAWSVCPACGALIGMESAGAAAETHVLEEAEGAEDPASAVAERANGSRRPADAEPRAITPFWRVDGLLEEYPFLLDFLTSYRCLSGLARPEGRRRAGRLTLERVAKRSGVPIGQLMGDIAAEVQVATGTRPPVVDLPEQTRTRFPTGPLVSALIVIIIGVVFFSFDSRNGDSEKADEYNRLSAQVIALRDQTDALEGELNRLFANGVLEPLITWPAGEVRLSDPSPKEAAALLPVLKEARTLLAEKNRDFASLAALWDKMAALDTGEARTTYCGQQKKLEEIDGQMGVLLDQYFAKLEEAVVQAPLSRAERKKLEEEISELFAQLGRLRSRLDERARASEQYYNENF
jgi:hypothetical protein